MASLEDNDEGSVSFWDQCSQNYFAVMRVSSGKFRLDFEALFEAHIEFFFKKNGPFPASFFVYFHSFLVTISIQIEKSLDGVLGIRTRGRRRNHGAMAATHIEFAPEILHYQAEALHYQAEVLHYKAVNLRFQTEGLHCTIKLKISTTKHKLSYFQ